jgi:hypothetical protein
MTVGIKPAVLSKDDVPEGLATPGCLVGAFPLNAGEGESKFFPESSVLEPGPLMLETESRSRK